MPRGKRNLDWYTDKGEMYWQDYIEVLKSLGSSRVGLFLVKGLDPRMSSSEGLVRTEGWSEGKGEDAEHFKAEVKFDLNFVCWVFTEKYKELGWIDGAQFHRNRLDTLSDLIEKHHGKEKERESEKDLQLAAQHLVRAGLYSDIELALDFIRSSQTESIPNNKAKAKAKEAVTA